MDAEVVSRKPVDTKDFAILFVDDEKQNLFSFRAAFRRDYKIFTAPSGQEALEIMRKEHIQLVISDQRMPEMSGVEFLEQVRNEFPQPVRMILTGFSDVAAVIDAINAGGVYRYITKPWEKAELKMSIENARELFSLTEKNLALLRDLQRNVEELQKTVQIFSRYVPEPVVEKALNNQGESIIRGEVREAAVLFCDIRNFTPISEALKPEEVVDFLNEFYSVMTEVVDRHYGSVNQFVGDEIFATFGAPIAHPNNEENAVFCAMEMMQRQQLLKENFEKRFGQTLDIGIGVNSGKVVAGNMGSEARINYSVVGDTVNTGKRIESLTKDAPNTILISDSVYQRTKHLIEVNTWEPVALKGKKEKIVVHEVRGKS